MYCIKCGAKLEDTEKACPLCNTIVYHPDIQVENKQSLYPSKSMPKSSSGRAFVCGAVIILFLIPLIVTFFSDFYVDRKIDWFGTVAGGILLAYIIFALPMWFKNANPVIFIPCDFVACALYLLYLNSSLSGGWFLTFALPVTLGLAVIVCTLVTLLRYLRKGKLYVIGGVVIALGVYILMIEYLMGITFNVEFSGWSFYPLISLFLIGGLLIYLAMNSVARAKIEKKLFF